MDNIKRAAEIITEWADKTIWANQLQCTTKEAFAFARLAKFAKEPEPERKAGELTREEAMIAYCSGKQIQFHPCQPGTWGVGQYLLDKVPYMQNIGKVEKIPNFNEPGKWRLFIEQLILVDGLTACEAYRAGKKVVRNYLVYQKGIAMHPDFTLDGWEIID